MKKKILSGLLIFSLLMGMMGTSYANVADVKGYTMVNPMAINSEMKITDLKTDNGSWKNASIKVSEVQIDNVGYKKINNTLKVKYSDGALKKLDAVKVKVTYTFSGFSGNKDSLVKDNLLAEEIQAVSTEGLYKLDGQLYSGFANGLYNKVEKYTLGGKTYKGEWYGKKIKDVNFAKPITMTGYVYLIMDKGKAPGSFVCFALSPNNDVYKSEVYFVFSNKTLESRIKNTGTYIYGDDKVGIFKTNFEMKEVVTKDSSSVNTGVFEKRYQIGTKDDPIIYCALFASDEGRFTEKEAKEYQRETAEKLADDYELKADEENGVYKIQGVSNRWTYVNIHIIAKGEYYYAVMVYSDVKEKESADKIWESYKANNDLTPAKPTSTTATSYTYGTKGYGMFTSPEKMKDITEDNNGLFQYEGKNGDWAVSMTVSPYDKTFTDNFESNTGLDKRDCQKVKLDNGNMNVYSSVEDPRDNYIMLTIVKNNKFYFMGIDAFKNKMPEVKIPVIKSYLLSIGYTESEVNVILSDGIFK